jgi:hypothetical protein
VLVLLGHYSQRVDARVHEQAVVLHVVKLASSEELDVRSRNLNAVHVYVARLA